MSNPYSALKDDYDKTWELYIRAASKSHELEDEVEKLEKSDYKFRYALWVSHGHLGLYGDDGEMQCAICRVDFKRDTPDVLITALTQTLHLPPLYPKVNHKYTFAQDDCRYYATQPLRGPHCGCPICCGCGKEME